MKKVQITLKCNQWNLNNLAAINAALNSDETIWEYSPCDVLEGVCAVLAFYLQSDDLMTRKQQDLIEDIQDLLERKLSTARRDFVE